MSDKIISISMYALVLVCVALIVVLCVGLSNLLKADNITFGDFVEISRVNDGRVIQYTVYNKYTHVVYIGILYGGDLSFVPYYMRNSFGEMTVGIYDMPSGMIVPAEFHDEEESMVLTG